MNPVRGIGGLCAGRSRTRKVPRAGWRRGTPGYRLEAPGRAIAARAGRSRRAGWAAPTGWTTSAVPSQTTVFQRPPGPAGPGESWNRSGEGAAGASRAPAAARQFDEFRRPCTTPALNASINASRILQTAQS